MLNKTSRRNIVSALGLVLSSTLFAPVANAACDGSALCAMENKGGFYVGGSLYYMRPSESGIGLVTDSWQYGTFTDATIASRSKPFNPKHDWEGGAKLGYDFCGSANTLELNYFHMDNSTDGFNDQSDGPSSFASVFFPGSFFNLPIPGFVSDAHLNYDLNQVTFLAKHGFVEGKGAFTLTPSVGLRWIELKHALLFAVGDVHSKFKGFGPVLGLDGTWGFAQCFGIVGRFDYSPLIGHIQSNSRLRQDPPGLGQSTFHSPKTDRIVHNVNAKLGVDYTYTFCNQQQAILELGWQASQYIDGTDMIRGVYRSAAGAAQAQRIDGIESNTFSFQGPYLDVVWHF